MLLICYNLLAVKMAEVRIASRTAVADRSGGGFFVRRVASPGAVVDKGAVKPLARRVPSPSSNKENVPPAWAAWAAPKRRSSLPEWYPRTPLRDITSVIKVINISSCGSASWIMTVLHCMIMCILAVPSLWRPKLVFTTV